MDKDMDSVNIIGIIMDKPGYAWHNNDGEPNTTDDESNPSTGNSLLSLCLQGPPPPDKPSGQLVWGGPRDFTGQQRFDLYCRLV
jgi:hypothetical protein